MLFPGEGQDIEFIDDVRDRLTQDELDKAFQDVWERPIKKTDVHGIDGTLFFELEFKKNYYPNKSERDVGHLP